MMPITSYKELVEALSWDDKRNQERWYIFLVMNPDNQTNAGIEVVKKISYLHRRTRDVMFFLPGFSNTMEKGIVPWGSFKGVLKYTDSRFGKLYFDQDGFLDTIDWLESGGNYRFREHLDLVIVKYCPKNKSESKIEIEQNFDRQNMIVYHLDELNDEGNTCRTLEMITECMEMASHIFSEQEMKHRLDNFIIPVVRNSNNYIEVFIAGSKTLTQERNAVVAALAHITNRSSKGNVFRSKTYEDFNRSFIEGGRQSEYNRYIANDATFAIFILDGTVGGITRNEFDVAYNAFKEHGKPEIYVYSHELDSEDGTCGAIAEIRRYIQETGQYYNEYSNIKDLQQQIERDFGGFGL